MADLLKFYTDNNFKVNKIKNEDEEDKNNPNNPSNSLKISTKDIYEDDEDEQVDIPEYNTFVKEEEPYNKEPSISGIFHRYYD